MPKEIPNVLAAGSKIDRSLPLEMFSTAISDLGLDDPVTKNFWLRLTEEIDQLKKRIDLLHRQLDAKMSKRDIDFPTEIEQSALRFQELVSKAPLVISTNQDLQDICSRLKSVPAIFDELREKPHLAELGMNDPYGGNLVQIRVGFVEDVHALYVHFSGLTDWITSSEYDSARYTNPFFSVLRLAYDAAGLDVSDSTIRSDIERADKPDKNPIP